MHIMEGFLPLLWAIMWYVVSIPFVLYGIMEIKKLFREHPEQKMILAVSGAFIFVLSSLKLPSVTGSSSQPTGTGVSSVLFGPAITSVMATIVLIFQAILLAHGGITTLGANVFSMGIAGPLIGWLAFKGMRSFKAGMIPSVFVAAVLADWVTYLVTSIQLALAYPGADIISSFTAFATVFAVTQVPLAIGEGIIMAIFFDFLLSNRPKMIREILKEKIGKASSETPGVAQ
ncbi:cobalamin biosynthesis protein CbiM [Methanocella sp. CWC-04]|uniref:Putative cobalt transport protein CbiM n=1 Tax=Methanooceanicella nereidis TaxID=2052831 RepID=A0AAP2RDQ9_9EURY|nr:cobalamin biosynthesis protein CbiM [Methanocella sp. CWC-04]